MSRNAAAAVIRRRPAWGLCMHDPDVALLVPLAVTAAEGVAALLIWKERRQLSRRAAIMLTALICSWSAAVWIGTGLWAERRLAASIAGEQSAAKAGAEAIGANIDYQLNQFRSIPAVMAREPLLASLLSHMGPASTLRSLPMAERNRAWRTDPDLGGLARRLGEIVAEIGLSAILVMDDAGDCVAEGNEPALPNFTGANYADRQYFIDAKNGKNGRQVTVGRVTDNMGLVHTSPVVADGRFVGAVGVRFNVDSLYRLVIEDLAFVTDQNGVVILARDPALLMRALPGAGVAGLSVTARVQQYKKREFDTLQFSPVEGGAPLSGLVRWGNRPGAYVMAGYQIPGEILTVHVLRELRDVTAIRQDRPLAFALVSLMGFLVVGLLTITVDSMRSRRQHRLDLMRLNDSLQASNRDLQEEVERRTRLQGEVSAALAAQLRLREERREFLRVLGHEIGTPLAVIDRSAEMIEIAPDTAVSRLETIRSAVRRLTRLTGSLMAAERASLGAPRMDALDAADVAREAVSSLDEVMGSIRLTTEHPGRSARFTGDRDMMVIALSNLLDNARKFSSPDQPIDVTVRANGAEVEILVADRGIGFPDREIGSVGQRHFRASNAKAIPGSGLGLSIVAMILDTHRGSIDIANRSGGGAVVTLHLPADER